MSPEDERAALLAEMEATRWMARKIASDMARALTHPLDTAILYGLGPMAPVDPTPDGVYVITTLE